MNCTQTHRRSPFSTPGPDTRAKSADRLCSRMPEHYFAFAQKVATWAGRNLSQQRGILFNVPSKCFCFACVCKITSAHCALGGGEFWHTEVYGRHRRRVKSFADRRSETERCFYQWAGGILWFISVVNNEDFNVMKNNAIVCTHCQNKTHVNIKHCVLYSCNAGFCLFFILTLKNTPQSLHTLKY
jgi:hypothetical protein